MSKVKKEVTRSHLFKELKKKRRKKKENRRGKENLKKSSKFRSSAPHRKIT